MARLQSDRHIPDQTREDREQSEDAAFARRMAHLPEDEMSAETSEHFMQSRTVTRPGQ